MNRIVFTVILLVVSNTFMTFAWYAHLRNLAHKPWFIAALISWGIALCEYLFQVPANRIGYDVLSLPQLKIIQEVITLTVFVPFAMLYMRESWSWNYVWAGLCLMGAVFFIFREPADKPSPPPIAVSSAVK
ncbi:MAG: DMT family protein [Pontiellaceae bacterium]|nr:DMT family protein [Pontiellaceae bacterium]MBN2784348.1 DMT family protein [Pontiellaceae bacterium]